MNAARTLTALALLVSAAAFAAEPPATSPEQPPATATPPASAEDATRAPGAGPIDPAPPAVPEPPKPAPPRTVIGTVRSVEGDPPRVVVEGEGGPTTVVVDRNTAIYLQKGWGTVRDVRAGESVRVSASPTDGKALWLEVMQPAGAAEKAEGSAVSPPTIPPGETAAPTGVGAPGTAPTVPGPGTPASPATPGR